jgi:hypothetical protein
MLAPPAGGDGDGAGPVEIDTVGDDSLSTILVVSFISPIHHVDALIVEERRIESPFYTKR